METFLVGGAVRDQVMGMEPKDLDFVVVGATPEQMIAKGFSQVGADFPVFLDPKTGNEHALARTERKTGEGHTGFETQHDSSVTLEEDLMRRDFTINAMARSLDPNVPDIIDPFGGQQDIENRLIRHVSVAFCDDPLRVLRAARFAARFNFDVADETMNIMTDMVARGELNSLSRERIWKEVGRAMEERFPARFFEVLREVNALPVLGIGNDNSLIQTVLEVARDRVSDVRWMRVSLAMGKERESFIEATNCPVHIQRLIRFVPAMAHAFNNESIDGIMDVARQFRLFDQENHDLLTAFHGMLSLMRSKERANRFLHLLVAFSAASAVNFSNLTEHQQKTLEGPDIGEAIFNIRKSIIAGAM